MVSEVNIISLKRTEPEWLTALVYIIAGLFAAIDEIDQNQAATKEKYRAPCLRLSWSLGNFGFDIAQSCQNRPFW